MLRAVWFLWFLGAIELTAFIGEDVDRDARKAGVRLSPRPAFLFAFFGTLIVFSSPAWISMLVVINYFPHLIGE